MIASCNQQRYSGGIDSSALAASIRRYLVRDTATHVILPASQQRRRILSLHPTILLPRRRRHSSRRWSGSVCAVLRKQSTRVGEKSEPSHRLYSGNGRERSNAVILLYLTQRIQRPVVILRLPGKLDRPVARGHKCRTPAANGCGGVLSLAKKRW
jgi:hypothetical protein